MLNTSLGLSVSKVLVVGVMIIYARGHSLADFDAPELKNFGNEVPQPPPLMFFADDSFQKKNNVNKFKNMMITKDNPDNMGDDDMMTRDGQIYYIPRVVSGKKRGAILSWALPGSRMRAGSSNYRQSSTFAVGNNRPAAKK